MMQSVAHVVPLPTAAPAPVQQAERWLSKREIAEHYGVTTRTIDNWCCAGMPWNRRGGYRRFLVSECEAWHDAR